MTGRTSYAQHKAFLEMVARGGEAELAGFLEAAERPCADFQRYEGALQRRYLQGFQDGKAKLMCEEVTQA